MRLLEYSVARCEGENSVRAFSLVFRFSGCLESQRAHFRGGAPNPRYLGQSPLPRVRRSSEPPRGECPAGQRPPGERPGQAKEADPDGGDRGEMSRSASFASEILRSEPWPISGGMRYAGGVDA